MAPRQAQRDVREVGRQPSAPKDDKKRPNGIRKEVAERSTRRSARLRTIEHYQGRTIKFGQAISQSTKTPVRVNPSTAQEPKDRKRRRSQEFESQPGYRTLSPARKRPRASVTSSNPNTYDQKAAASVTKNVTNPIDCWRKEGHWPAELFTPESNMNHLLARKKSSSSVRGRTREASSAAASSSTPSDQKLREAKTSLYARPSYETALALKGSYMSKSDFGITEKSKKLCRILLEAEQSIPQNTLFRDDLFEQTCDSVRARNEAMVVRDISPLICPSAQVLRIYGAEHLKSLNESVNEGWNSAISYYGPRPQPDYSIGFGRSAFTDNQLKKLLPFVGEVTDTFTSYFMATWQMYFPFLTCEVKCGTAALDVADRQNAHSMTLAVRACVELFKLLNREKELHREILAFSISHDHRTVRIYGHYPIIDGDKTAFYRHPIRDFSFTELDGREKWAAYRFTKNVYDIWMPSHLRRICSVIDDLPPNIDFEISQQLEPAESGLSQGLESNHLSDYSAKDAAEETGSQSSRVSSRDVTPDTSLSQRMSGGASKKLKKRARPEELHH